jgi:hypothetical protein
MKERTKIVIAVVVTFFLTIGLVVGLLVGGLVGLFFDIDRTTKINMKNEEQARIDAREFGKTTNQNGCLEKGFSLGPGNRYVDLIFVRECLESSQPIPNFCEGVPPRSDRKSEVWVADQCANFPNQDACHQTMSTKQSYCDDQKRKKNCN